MDGDVVGRGELHVRSQEQRQGEITYVVHPHRWGQGVGTAMGMSSSDEVYAVSEVLLRHGC
ncbi:GNAT family N-acetyltransferase [Nonomuraea sp. NPDC047529]|uniref:GNAT family N-acetyltransferase n=1 Tax=Nonomuraea sp. NPDC047529 TaxID=3155623 RepID=UPI0033D898E4